LFVVVGSYALFVVVLLLLFIVDYSVVVVVVGCCSLFVVVVSVGGVVVPCCSFLFVVVVRYVVIHVIVTFDCCSVVIVVVLPFYDTLLLITYICCFTVLLLFTLLLLLFGSLFRSVRTFDSFVVVALLCVTFPLPVTLLLGVILPRCSLACLNCSAFCYVTRLDSCCWMLVRYVHAFTLFVAFLHVVIHVVTFTVRYLVCRSFVVYGPFTLHVGYLRLLLFGAFGEFYVVRPFVVS